MWTQDSGTSMTISVVKINNWHIKIVLKLLFILVFLAVFVKWFIKFLVCDSGDSHIEENDLLGSFYLYPISSKNISNFNKLNSFLTLNWIKVISCLSYVEEVTGVFFPLKHKLWIHFLRLIICVMKDFEKNSETISKEN